MPRCPSRRSSTARIRPRTSAPPPACCGPAACSAVCDDVLTAAGATASPRDAQRIEEFRAGWRISSLLTVDEIGRHAAGAGLTLVGDDDLTPYLALHRPRDRVVRLLVAATRPLPLRGEYWWSLAGGDALRHCLATGLFGYRLLLFRRSAEA